MHLTRRGYCWHTAGAASAPSWVHYLGGRPWRSGPPQSSVCCLRPPRLSAPRLWTHTGWPVGSPLTLTQLNHVNYAICSPSSPYGIHRGGFIPSESLWSVKKKKKKLKIESKVFSGLPSAGGLLYVVGPSRLQRRERRGVLVFTLRAFTLPALSRWNKRRCAVEGLQSDRQTGYECGCCSYSG